MINFKLYKSIQGFLIIILLLTIIFSAQKKSIDSPLIVVLDDIIDKDLSNIIVPSSSLVFVV